VSWEYQTLIPALASVGRGMLAIWCEPSAHLKPRDVWAIRFFLDEHRRLRDRALFDLAIDSKLRGCDIVKMKIGGIVTGTVRISVCGRAVEHYAAMALMKRSPKMTAN
jgi:hypothetical protein